MDTQALVWGLIAEFDQGIDQMFVWWTQRKDIPLSETNQAGKLRMKLQNELGVKFVRTLGIEQFVPQHPTQETMMKRTSKEIEARWDAYRRQYRWYNIWLFHLWALCVCGSYILCVHCLTYINTGYKLEHVGFLNVNLGSFYQGSQTCFATPSAIKIKYDVLGQPVWQDATITRSTFGISSQIKVGLTETPYEHLKHWAVHEDARIWYLVSAPVSVDLLQRALAAGSLLPSPISDSLQPLLHGLQLCSKS